MTEREEALKAARRLDAYRGYPEERADAQLVARALLSSAAAEAEMREALEAILKDIATPLCEHLHHPPADRHSYSEACPVEARLNAAITKADAALSKEPGK